MSEQLRHKMTDHAVPPPPAAWQSIAERLEDDIRYSAVSSKLKHFEVAPPALAWTAISTSLNDEPKSVAPVVSRTIIYRMAAAAIVIGFIIGGWIMVNNHIPQNALVKNAFPAKSVNPGNATNTATAVGKGIGIPPATLPVFVDTTIALLPQNNMPRSAFYVPAADKDNTLGYAIINDDMFTQRVPASTVYAPPLVDRNGQPISNIDVLTTNSNYLLVTGPDGHLTRISSKFANVIRFINGSPEDTDEYLDKVIKESGVWKKRFTEWRSKISQSAYIPSSANFLDIVELSRLVQEK